MERLADLMLISIIPLCLFSLGIFIEIWPKRYNIRDLRKFFPLVAIAIYNTFLDPFMSHYIHYSVIALCLIAFLILNYANLGLVIFSIGGLLNCVVAFANGFKMPVAGEFIKTRLYTPLTDPTNFPILCDWISTPNGFYLMSVGDIVISIGMCLVFYFSVKKVYFKI